MSDFSSVSDASGLAGASRPGPLRELRIFLGGREIARSCRMKLFLLESLSLLPALYSLNVVNLSESSEALVCAAASLEVRSGDSVLASGRVLSVCPRIQDGKRILSITFSPGMNLWQSTVSLSLAAGMSVSDTLREVLSASGSGVPLAAFLAEDKRMTRPQSFFGRTCDALRTLGRAVGARVWLSPAGLCVLDPSRQEPTLFLTEADYQGEPLFLPDRYVLATQVRGWPLGTGLRFTWKGRGYQGLLAGRILNLDNAEGPWLSQVEIIPSGGDAA